ncbi:MAG: hypothetical protein ACRERE_02740 [Candidatus Entotheonellia bacterium]
MTVNQIYEQTIKLLSMADRLRLAALILNDIPPHAVVDYSDEWSEEDLRDFRQASWEHVDSLLEDEEHA